MTKLSSLFCSTVQAFGAVEAMSDRVCIASGGNANAHISAEDLLSCCTSCGMGYVSVSVDYLLLLGNLSFEPYN